MDHDLEDRVLTLEEGKKRARGRLMRCNRVSRWIMLGLAWGY
ncbi:hypothetical protein Golob_024659 [Gossypium lobatum]|uniref:Uncharacterized protein n=1 Tax=Gossypium lobatum TaxID=34289 RepID=A0A7J8NDK8_9ROSI|nr:hypothetical protein [Gossypium lobatum]